jgi:ABC-type transporter lipoprotein component MlaA
MDPYKAFPALANYVFSYADTLSRAGQTDSASVILNSFSSMAPMWEKWQAQSDTLRDAFGKRREEKAKEFESMALQIQNMNRVQASYSMVAETADSLISQLAPGDSLANWAEGQKKIAYKNTLKKAQKEFDGIKTLADEKAQFAEARKQTEEFRMRYRDFEDTLHVQAFLAHVDELEKATDSETAKMWEKNDPAAALAKADTLIATEKFEKAKDLLNKLKSSKLRKEATEKYIVLADAYCNKQRKTTSQLFAKSQKQTDEVKKKKLLNDAMAPLDKCLTEFPETTQREKVESNKKFIEKELAK